LKNFMLRLKHKCRRTFSHALRVELWRQFQSYGDKPVAP
jgi:hypothetical protein